MSLQSSSALELPCPVVVTDKISDRGDGDNGVKRRNVKSDLGGATTPFSAFPFFVYKCDYGAFS